MYVRRCELVLEGIFFNFCPILKTINKFYVPRRLTLKFEEQ